jgi:Uncharacterized protein conserved in bacteria (DUF2199)
LTKSNVSRASGGKVGGKASTEPCACCGIAPDPRGRPFSIVFEQPDVVSQIEPELLDTWGTDPFIAIKNVGFFVRVILPVQLTDGFSVEFGTWLEVRDDDFREAWKVWNSPEYSGLVIEGYMANEIEPWSPFPHAMIRAAVRDVDQVPYLVASDAPLFARILGEVEPHADVLAPYASLLKSDAPLQN